MKKIAVLGVHVSTEARNELLRQAAVYVTGKSTRPLTIVTPNPEQIVYAQKDEHARRILNTADIALPDGSGLIWANRLVHSSWFMVHGRKLRTTNYELRTIPGVEFMEDLVTQAANSGKRIACIGGYQAVATKSLQRLQKKYPQLVGWADGDIQVRFFRNTVKATTSTQTDVIEKIAEKIIAGKIQYVFIAFGHPKQEFFMEKLQETLLQKKIAFPVVLMVVGGAFDEISGRLPRPPQWVSNLGFKWLWRLILEPWRFKRQLVGAQFFWKILTQHKSDSA